MVSVISSPNRIDENGFFDAIVSVRELLALGA